MRAAVYAGDKRVEPADVPVPDLGDTDVLIDVSHCGICGTDVHMVTHGWAQPGRIGGHEWSGVVRAVGAGVTRWEPGDRVVGGPAWCGECEFCRTGRPTLCRRDGLATGDMDGGAEAFAEVARATEAGLYRIPDGLDLRTASLAEPLAVAMHGVTRGNVRPGQRVLVMGAGPIGLLTIAVLRARGIDDVTVSEPSERRREHARAAGATAFTTPDAIPEPPAMPTFHIDGVWDAVFECSGVKAAQSQAFGVVGPGGTIVLVGAGMGRPSFDANRVLLNELVVTGAYNYDEHGIERALELLASGRLPVAALIEADDVSLDGMQAALEGLAAGTIPSKVLINPTL
jgi:(R,R)-butanediol dehydrogenase/meso-butanediol dehydrogenase/diacetyl reductase